MAQQQKQNASANVKQFSVGEIVYVKTPASIRKQNKYLNKWAMRAGI